MSEQKVAVDDSSGSLVYSGQWSSTSDAGAFDGTVHSTTSVGASVSLSFTGFALHVVGSVPPCTVTGGAVMYEVVMNGATVQSSSLICTVGQTQNQVLLYSTTTTSNAPVQVSLINQGSNLPLILDLFAYVTDTTTSSGGVEGTSTTVQETTSGSSSGSLSTTSSGVSTSASGAISLGSSTSESSGSSTTGLVSVGSAMASSIFHGVASSPTSTTTSSDGSNPDGPSQAPSRASGSHFLGPILGGILAAIIMILLLLLLLRCRRRRRAGSSLSERSPEGVTPFNLDQASSQEQEDRSPSTSAGSIGQQQPLSPFPDEPTQAAASPFEKHHLLESSSSSSELFSPTSPESAFMSDEKRASGQPSPTMESDSNPQSQPPPQSTPSRPPSSISPSEAVPAYIRDPNNRHRSGLSTLTDSHASQILDVPPSYLDSVSDARVRIRPELPPLPQLRHLSEDSRTVADPSRLV